MSIRESNDGKPTSKDFEVMSKLRLSLLKKYIPLRIMCRMKKTIINPELHMDKDRIASL